MASNNQHNNNNQPRRKRNKKPVKRYSEEYNNRPNPYTGYSSDGNYHPGAKKRSIDDASSPKTSANAGSRAGQGASQNQHYDYSRAAMTDAVWPRVGASQNQPAVKPVPAAASQRLAESAAPSDKNAERYQEPASASHDMADLAETAAKLENEGGSQNADSAEGTGSNTPRRKSGSHRKKHTNKQETEQARKAKMEAKKAALDKIAQGVAAHSVSEQMIDDISNMSEAIENMSKAEKTVKAEQTSQSGGGVNWDELYDAAFPPKEQKPENDGKSAGKDKKKKAKKQRLDFDEVSEQNEPMLVKPVMLGEDEALPYDLIVEENAREAEEAKAIEEARAKAAEKAKEAERKRLAEADSFKNPPLEPSDLIPVLDFGKPEKPAADITAPVEDAVDAAEDIIDVADTVSIEEIIGAVEREKFSEAQNTAAIAAAASAANAEFVFGGVDFDTEQSEGWHEIAPPAPEDTDVPSEQPAPSELTGDDESVSLLSQRLLESYMELEDQPLEYIPPDGADDFPPEALGAEAEPAETVDLNQFYAPTDVSVPVEVEVEPTPEEITVDSSASEDIAEAAEADNVVAVDIDIAEIEDEIFAETDIASLEEEPVAEAAEEAPESGENAVKEKIEKLVEAAELAEVLRQESEDAAPEEVQPDAEIDIFSVTPPVDDSTDSGKPLETVVAEEEVIREYRPRKTPKLPKDENVFESVLIVDDSRSVVDGDAAKKQDDRQFLHTAAAENPTAVFRLPDGPLVLPADVDDADFQEHWLDEDEDGDEMATRTKRTRRRISAFIGGVAILFVVMVVVSVLSTVITGFSNIGSTNEKKLEYSEFITPVVLNDPAPFETIDKADNQMLLESAIWRVLNQMSATEDYEYTYDATRKIVISADDVAKAGRELFGSDVQLNMNVLSESDGSAIYYYDSIDNSFHISTGSLLGPAPVITKMAQKSDYVSLVVGYVNQDELSLTSSDDEVECYKYMEYVLALESDDTYYIQSVRDYVEE